MELTNEQMISYIASLEYQVAKYNDMLMLIAETNPEALESPEMLSFYAYERQNWN